MDTEGIYRVSGNKQDIESLLTKFDAGGADLRIFFDFYSGVCLRIDGDRVLNFSDF